MNSYFDRGVYYNNISIDQSIIVYNTIFCAFGAVAIQT